MVGVETKGGRGPHSGRGQARGGRGRVGGRGLGNVGGKTKRREVVRWRGGQRFCEAVSYRRYKANEKRADCPPRGATWLRDARQTQTGRGGRRTRQMSGGITILSLLRRVGCVERERGVDVRGCARCGRVERGREGGERREGWRRRIRGRRRRRGGERQRGAAPFGFQGDVEHKARHHAVLLFPHPHPSLLTDPLEENRQESTKSWTVTRRSQLVSCAPVRFGASFPLSLNAGAAYLGLTRSLESMVVCSSCSTRGSRVGEQHVQQGREQNKQQVLLQHKKRRAACRNARRAR